MKMKKEIFNCLVGKKISISDYEAEIESEKKTKCARTIRFVPI